MKSWQLETLIHQSQTLALNIHSLGNDPAHRGNLLFNVVEAVVEYQSPEDTRVTLTRLMEHIQDALKFQFVDV